MKAVILAGGLGTRLRPFTELMPKPLLPVGESSVLEIQLLSLARQGVNEVIVATHYKSDEVKAFLGNGEKYGVRLTFSQEPFPLGTCGPVTLLKDRLTEPFLLMNGDILTTLDFMRLRAFAGGLDAGLTVVTKEIITPFHFGTVASEGDYVVGVREKPDIKFEILAGIYVLKPELFGIIPEKTYYGIDSLIREMLRRGKKIGKYLSRDYWLDIGRVEDYQQAQLAYTDHFSDLKVLEHLK